MPFWWDEAAYLNGNPDVKTAQAGSGGAWSGWDHWQKFGRAEGRKPAYMQWEAGFSDPSTKLLEQYLTDALATLSGQAGAFAANRKGYEAQQTASATALQELIKALTGRAGELQTPVDTSSVDAYITALQGQAGTLQTPVDTGSTDAYIKALLAQVTELQGPAYTGSEQEVLRTQLLDPIERDRTAAQQRALGRISQQGYLPTSGVAYELQNLVDRGFDEDRAQAQGEIAYRQITEERSRDQEALKLLGLIPGLERDVLDYQNSRSGEATDLLGLIPGTERSATTFQDNRTQAGLDLLGLIPGLHSGGATQALAFQGMLDAAQNAPMMQGINIATLLQQLPHQALMDALAAMGQGGSADGLSSDYLNLFNAQQGQQVPWWAMLGSTLPALMNAWK
jgi:hypothetical protein